MKPGKILFMMNSKKTDTKIRNLKSCIECVAATHAVATFPKTRACLGSVHISSVRKILSAKARLQGKKRSKVEHLASIFNAAGAFLSQNIAA